MPGQAESGADGADALQFSLPGRPGLANNRRPKREDPVHHLVLDRDCLARPRSLGQSRDRRRHSLFAGHGNQSFPSLFVPGGWEIFAATDPGQFGAGHRPDLRAGRRNHRLHPRKRWETYRILEYRAAWQQFEKTGGCTGVVHENANFPVFHKPRTGERGGIIALAESSRFGRRIPDPGSIPAGDRTKKIHGPRWIRGTRFTGRSIRSG